MYISYYGLKAEPFRLTPDPQFLHLSETHQAALTVVVESILYRKGLVMITGPIGTGNTHLAIIDDASGQLIYGEAPYTEVPQASTTKIATTIVALERSPDLARRIKVTVSASAMVARDGSSTMGIEPGRSVTRICST